MLLGAGAIFLQLCSVVALGMLIFGSKTNKYLAFIKNNFLEIGFLISFSAFLTSLFYSEIVHYVPCFLCWYDRVFIFPQAVIFAVALYRKEKNALYYALPLTILGLINSLYHIYIYNFGEGGGPCDASGISCVQKLVNEFGGYISIPMLALTGFFALFVLLMVAHFYKNEN
jgi:disulfide bond formation protein DsbB